MAQEPEHPMEKKLRHYAEQRQAEADPPTEMHPATRRLLQGEIKRQYGRTASKGTGPNRKAGFWAWLALAWPRFGLALGLFVVLGGWMVWHFNQEDNRLSLAKTDAPAEPAHNEIDSQDALKENQEENSGALKQLAPGESIAPKTTPAPRAYSNSRNRGTAPADPLPPDSTSPPLMEEPRTSPAILSENKDATAAAAGVTASNATSPSAVPRLSMKPLRQNRSASPPSPPPPSTPNRSVVTSRAVSRPLTTEETRLNSSVLPSFAQGDFYQSSIVSRQQPPGAQNQTLFRANDVVEAELADQDLPVATQPTLATQNQIPSGYSNVLREFRFLMTNGLLQVRDQDGSVYEGIIWPVAYSGREAMRSIQVQEAITQSETRADNVSTDTWRFRVQGTNLALKEALEFRGFITTNTAKQINLNKAVDENSVAGSATTRRKRWIEGTIYLGPQTSRTNSWTIEALERPIP